MKTLIEVGGSQKTTRFNIWRSMSSQIFVGAALVLFLMASLLGCQAGISTTIMPEKTTMTTPFTIPSQSQVQRNRLELISQGITYQLVEHWVYTFKNGISADGKWFDKLALEMDPDLKADLAAAEEIPYADDIRFRRVWSSGSEEMTKSYYDIYDSNLESLYNNIDKLEITPEAGLYYVAVFASWGEPNSRDGYQYIFKIRRS